LNYLGIPSLRWNDALLNYLGVWCVGSCSLLTIVIGKVKEGQVKVKGGRRERKEGEERKRS